MASRELLRVALFKGDKTSLSPQVERKPARTARVLLEHPEGELPDPLERARVPRHSRDADRLFPAGRLAHPDPPHSNGGVDGVERDRLGVAVCQVRILTTPGLRVATPALIDIARRPLAPDGYHLCPRLASPALQEIFLVVGQHN